MNFLEYQEKAKRTCPDLGSFEKNLLHMKAGLATELGELIDIHKKKLAYNKPVDEVNEREEIGDFMWYLGNGFTLCNTPLKASLLNNDKWDFKKYDKPLTESEDCLGFLLDLSEMKSPPYFKAIVFYAERRGFDIEEIMERNIAKLMIRYPEKFTQENAINRNLEQERKILEQ